MNASRTTRRRRTGFTLVEMSVSLAIGSICIAGMLSLYITYLRSFNTTTLMYQSGRRASLALERMVYGISTNPGLREAQVDSVVGTNWATGWSLKYNTNYWFAYSSTAQIITNETRKVLCTNVAASTLTLYTNSCIISVTVVEKGGGDTWTNTMSTLVEFRN